MSLTPTDHRRDVSQEPNVVAEQLDLLRKAIDDATASWTARVRSESIEPLATLLRQTADAHERMVETLNDQDPSEQILSYRHGLQFEVVERLHRGLIEARPGEVLAAAQEQLIDTLSAIVSDVDEEVLRLEPEGRFLPEATDGWIRRLRKKRVRAVRARSRAYLKLANVLRRHTRRARREPQRHMQHVPLRQLASYHLDVRIPLALRAVHEEICTEVGLAMAVAGRVVTEHVHSVLREEVEVRLGALKRADARAGQEVDTVVESSVDEDPPLSGVGKARRQERSASLLSRANPLHSRLREAAEQLTGFDVPGRTRERSARLFDRLQRDVFEIDSFMLDLSKREVEKSTARFGKRDARWSTWYARILTRVGLMGRLLDFKGRCNELENRLITEIFQQVIRPSREALQHVEMRLDELSSRAEEAFIGRATAGDVRGHLDNALRAVEQEALGLLRGGRLTQVMRMACSEVAVELSDLVQALPERLEINVLDDRGVDPDRPPKLVEFREPAARAYDARVLEELQGETDHLARALTAACDEVEWVPSILRFNLGSALDDLDAESGDEDQSAAHELVVDGLARSADVLGAADLSLNEAFEVFELRIREVLEGSFMTLHERIRVEERMREQILDLRSEARAGLRQITKRASERAGRAAAIGRRTYGTLVRRSRRWIRLGQAATGLAAATEEDRFATLDALVGIEHLSEGLPLVYRRLFTFEPLRDPSLLVGREQDIQAIRTHIGRRKSGLTNALIITGFHGSGHTSFLNVLRQSVPDVASVRILDLRRRVRTEKELVGMLARTLGLTDGLIATFDELSQEIVSREVIQETQVCFVEHLEHLYLRQVGGTELVQAFLSFVSRTDSRVLWIVTVGDHGWQVISTTEPTASRLGVVHALSPVSRSDLEAVVLNRHQRSGLSLHFETPSTEGNPLLARRLRNVRTAQERQTILRTDYFDRLQRVCGQNVMLALFYWLRSVEMDESSELLRVRPVKPLSFDFLQTLPLEHVFTLKALLEHASLSLQEHSDVFLIPPDRSEEILEALGNLHLIEPLEKRRGHSRFALSTVGADERYRIRPFLVHPIIQYLRGKNVVH